MRITRTFTLDEDIAKKIETLSKSSNRNKSDVAESLIKRGLGQISEETIKVQEVEKEVAEMKISVEKILKIVTATK